MQSTVNSVSEREALFILARDALVQNRSLAITGPTGMGKTTFAQEFVRRFVSQYRLVMWLNAATYEGLLADCVDWVGRLGLSLLMEETFPLRIQSLRNWLSIQKDYLLVVDGIDHLAMLQQVFPGHLAGHVLLTTSMSNVPNEMANLRLEPLTMHESASLLLRQAGMITESRGLERLEAGEQQAVLTLTQSLHGYPLALDMAGAIIKAAGWSISDYLTKYHAVETGLISSHPQIDESNTLVTTIGVAESYIAQEFPQVQEIIHMCALLAPGMIPANLFAKRSSEVLKHLVLINQHSATMFQIHPLVQKIWYNRLAPSERQYQQEQALLTLHHHLPTLEGTELSLRLCYVTHIQHVLDQSEQWTFVFPEAAEVFSWAAMVMTEQAECASAARLLERALVIWEHCLGPTDPTVMMVIHNLATLFEKLGKFGEAEKLLHRVILTRTQTLGAGHTDTILSLNNLGFIYAKQHKSAEAEGTYCQALAVCKAVSHQNDALEMLIQYNLALLYLNTGRFAEAEPLFREAYTYHMQISGMRTLKTMRVADQLAHTLIGLEQWQEAKQILELVLPRYEDILGKTHADVIECLHQLMIIAVHLDHINDVKSLVNHIIATRDAQQLMPNTPKKIASLAGVAGICIGAERYADAEQILQYALALCEQIPELGTLTLTLILNMLAMVLMREQKNDSSIQTLQRALRTWEETLDPLDPAMEVIRREYYNQISLLVP